MDGTREVSSHIASSPVDILCFPYARQQTRLPNDIIERTCSHLYAAALQPYCQSLPPASCGNQEQALPLSLGAFVSRRLADLPAGDVMGSSLVRVRFPHGV